MLLSTAPHGLPKERHSGKTKRSSLLKEEKLYGHANCQVDSEGRERKEFAETMKGVVPKVRQEAGNRAYTMCQSKENPRVFMFYEEYVDDEAFKAHRKHLGELGVNLGAILDGAPVLEFYEKIAS